MQDHRSGWRKAGRGRADQKASETNGTSRTRASAGSPTQEYDAGDTNVRANQAAAKFQSMANKTSLSKGDLDGVAADGDASDTSVDGDDLEAGMSESDPSSQDEDEGFSMVTASLLDDVHLNTKRQDSHLLPLRKSSSSKPPAVSSASTKAPASSSRASPKPSRSSNGSLIGASPASASASDAGGADEGVRKLRGKSVEDILGKHGHAAHQAVLDEILTIMKKPCFDSMLTGGSLGNYVHEVEGLRRKAATLLRGAMNLDIKVKKWKDVPERVNCVLATERARAKALTDAFAAFTGVAKNNDSQRMEVAKAALESVDIPVPKAFHVLFFKEQACDFIRCRRLDNFTAHMQMDGGGFIKEGMFSETDNLTDTIADTIADALKMLAQGCVEQGGGGTVKNSESAVSDWTLVHQAVSSVGAVSDRSSALIKLLSMMDNEGPGVLMPMLREPSCRVLLTFLQKHYVQEHAALPGDSVAMVHGQAPATQIMLPDMHRSHQHRPLRSVQCALLSQPKEQPSCKQHGRR